MLFRILAFFTLWKDAISKDVLDRHSWWIGLNFFLLSISLSLFLSAFAAGFLGTLFARITTFGWFLGAFGL